MYLSTTYVWIRVYVVVDIQINACFFQHMYLTDKHVKHENSITFNIYTIYSLVKSEKNI